LQRASTTLLKAGSSIPEEKKTALQNVLMETITKNHGLLGVP